MARLWGHGAEGVGTAGGEGVHADEQHVHQQRPGVAVRQEVQGGAEDGETPQKVPANNPRVLRLHQNGRHHLQTTNHSALLIRFGGGVSELSLELS